MSDSSSRNALDEIARSMEEIIGEGDPAPPPPGAIAAGAGRAVVPTPVPPAPAPFPAGVDSALVARASSAWNRFLECVAGLDLIAAMLPESDGLAAARASRDAAIAAAARLSSMPPGDLGRVDAIGALEQALETATASVLALEASIPADRFREGLDTLALPEVTAWYAAGLLARTAADSWARAERTELLMAIALSVRGATGRLALRPFDEVRPALEPILPAPSSSPERRAEDARSLEESAQRIAALAGPEGLFDAGLYGDLYAFKRSLRNDLLSAEVLYAAVRCDVEVRNLLERITDGAARTASFRRIQQEEQRIQQLFRDTRADSGSETARFDPRPLRNKLSATDAEAAPGTVPRARRSTGAIVYYGFAALVLLGGGALLAHQRPTEYRIEEVPPSSLGVAAELVERAELTVAGGMRDLVVWIPQQWSAVDAAERARRASALESLASQPFDSVSVRVGEWSVMEIAGGQVIFRPDLGGEARVEGR